MTYRLNNIAMTCHRRIFWDTPYKTGNLARNGISDLRQFDAGQVGFTLFGKGTEYGALLNEAPTIFYTLTNRLTNTVYTGEYVNKHYRWVDNFADKFANEIPVNFPGTRRVA